MDDIREHNRRRGVRQAIAWLHEEARRMNDPHAKSVLNNAGFHLGIALKVGQLPAAEAEEEGAK